MASPVNQHCVDCIGTVSFPIQKKIVSAVVQYGQNVRWSHTGFLSTLRLLLPLLWDTHQSYAWECVRPVV